MSWSRSRSGRRARLGAAPGRGRSRSADLSWAGRSRNRLRYVACDTSVTQLTPHTAGHERLELQGRVIVLNALAFDLLDPARAIGGLAVGAGQAPGVAPVGPVRRLKAVRLPKVFDCRRLGAASVQSLAQREVRSRRRFFDRTRSTAADHFIRREYVGTLAAAPDPVAKRSDVPLRLDVQCPDQLDAFTLRGRRIRRHLSVQVGGPTGMRGLGRPHDHTLFIYPDPAGHVHDAKKGFDEMRLVDERRMFGRCLRDPRAGGLDAARIKSDGHDLETLRPELGPQLLPHGQVKTAASPRCPRDQKHLCPPQRRQAEGSATEVRQLQLRRNGAVESAPTYFRTDRP